MCIERQINSAIIKANRIKYRSLNESLSLDEKTTNDDRPLIETVYSLRDVDPIKYLLNLETQNEFYDKVKDVLSPFELEILNLRIMNFEYKEIATKLNKSYKSIDSGLQRIKNKLRLIFKD
jgi:DNA-directed RNA polymerase specialized sigma24 family protein